MIIVCNRIPMANFASCTSDKDIIDIASKSSSNLDTVSHLPIISLFDLTEAFENEKMVLLGNNVYYKDDKLIQLLRTNNGRIYEVNVINFFNYCKQLYKKEFIRETKKKVTNNDMKKTE